MSSIRYRGLIEVEFDILDDPSDSEEERLKKAEEALEEMAGYAMCGAMPFNPIYATGCDGSLENRGPSDQDDFGEFDEAATEGPLDSMIAGIGDEIVRLANGSPDEAWSMREEIASFATNKTEEGDEIL